MLVAIENLYSAELFSNRAFLFAPERDDRMHLSTLHHQEAGDIWMIFALERVSLHLSVMGSTIIFSRKSKLTREIDDVFCTSITEIEL